MVNMVQDRTHMYANPGNAAKEQSEYIHKGLEHALYQTIQEAGSAGSAVPMSIKAVKGRGGKKNAVDFFMARRERCDRYVKVSVAPTKEEREEMEVEKEAKKQEKIHQATPSGKCDVEKIEVKVKEGEVKLPPMYVNQKNSYTKPRLFSGDDNGSVTAWAPVKMNSPRMTENDFCIDSLMTDSCISERTSVFGTNGGASNGNSYQPITQTSKYRPVAFMNYKPKTDVRWREDGNHAGLNTKDSVNDILAHVRAKEAEQEAAILAAEAEQNKKNNKPEPTNTIGLSKLSLNDGVGKWRPSGQSWGKAPDTEGFLKAMGLDKQVDPDPYQNPILQKALQDAELDARVQQEQELATKRMSEADEAKRAECVKKSKMLFH